MAGSIPAGESGTGRWNHGCGSASARRCDRSLRSSSTIATDALRTSMPVPTAGTYTMPVKP